MGPKYMIGKDAKICQIQKVLLSLHYPIVCNCTLKSNCMIIKRDAYLKKLISVQHNGMIITGICR